MRNQNRFSYTKSSEKYSYLRKDSKSYYEKVYILIKNFRTIFYLIEKFLTRIFKKYNFFGLGRLIRKNGSLAVIIFIATFVSFSNIYARSDNDTFLVGYWQNEANKITPQNNGELFTNNESIISDNSFNQNIQIVSGSGNEELLSEITNTRRATGASDPENEGDVTVYTVKEGDTIGQIALNYKVSVNTILWANEIESITALKPGTTLFILPTSGLKHLVKKNETIDQIAKKYEVDKNQIIAFNDLPANGELQENQELIIPGGEKEEPQALVPRREYVSPTAPVSTGATAVKNNSGRRQPWNHFPGGYCTYYVAQRVKVTWRGNAGTWLYNAKAQGYSTGKTPKVGSIMVSSEDARYGHVAFVEAVDNSTFTVAEMNWKGFNIVNKRTISKNAGFIKGFVYP